MCQFTFDRQKAVFDMDLIYLFSMYLNYFLSIEHSLNILNRVLRWGGVGNCFNYRKSALEVEDHQDTKVLIQAIMQHNAQ